MNRKTVKIILIVIALIMVLLGGIYAANTICIICSFMGLISPAPDYMDVVSVIRKAPGKAMIQDSPNGLYYYPDK